jgi:2-dehydropantoate 2-reductase
MRFIIYGAGAIGGTIGFRLAQAGYEVVLIARGAQLQALRTTGLRLVSPHDDDVRRIPAVGHPGEIAFAPDDVVFLTTKTQDTDAALRDLLVASGGADIPVVCAQNGVENERLAARRFRRVYSMMVWLPAAFEQPGEVVCYCTPRSGILDLGCYPQGTDGTAQAIADALEHSGFSARALADIMRSKYTKLLMNVVAVMPALCGPAGRDSGFAWRLREEALACYAAGGIEAASSDEESARQAESGIEVGNIAGRVRAGGSVWQSLARDTGSVETDYINGEIVLLGAQHGVAVPCNRAAVFYANRLARGHHKPGTVPLADLERFAALN